MAFGVQWRLAASQPSPPVDEALPVIARHLLTGYDAVSQLTGRRTTIFRRWRWPPHWG